MFDLLLAALLAQTTPAPDITPVAAPLANPSISASPEASAAGMPAGRRGFPGEIRRNPSETPAMTTGDALIRNSGSTNTAGYVIVVHSDFSADIADGNGGTTRKMVAAPQAKWLFEKLKAAQPFTSLGYSRCMKSASFGSFTTIAYDGQTTPDLQCPASPETRELNRTVGVIVEQLGISTRRSPGAMRL